MRWAVLSDFFVENERAEGTAMCVTEDDHGSTIQCLLHGHGGVSRGERK